MIQESLTKLGLTEKEALIYLTMLEQGKASHGAIARLTKINRTTVYSVAKELADKGLIAEDLGAVTTYLVALPPGEIQNLLAKREKELHEQKQVASELIGQLQQITQHTQYTIPKINFVEEKKLEDYLYKRTPTWHESILQYDGVWWGFQDPSFVEHYEKWIDWQWQTAASPKISLKLLTSASPTEEKMKQKHYERRQLKVWTKTQNFTGTTWVNGDYLALIITHQRPHYLVEIHDAVLAHNMRELFKGIWEDI